MVMDRTMFYSRLYSLLLTLITPNRDAIESKNTTGKLE